MGVDIVLGGYRRSDLYCLSFVDLNSRRRTSTLTNEEVCSTKNVGITCQVTANNHCYVNRNFYVNQSFVVEVEF